jgi:LexA DNA binding domain-containing protein
MMDIRNKTVGKSVSDVTRPDPQRLAIHFTDDSILSIAFVDGHLSASVTLGPSDSISIHRETGPQPTRRQRDYLEFIGRYVLRYGVSPAESDIARHFLVSAPSVNQMVRMLERRGFITRRPGVPRSITIVDDRKPTVRPGQATAGGPRPNNALHRPGARVARSGR